MRPKPLIATLTAMVVMSVNRLNRPAEMPAILPNEKHVPCLGKRDTRHNKISQNDAPFGVETGPRMGLSSKAGREKHVS